MPKTYDMNLHQLANLVRQCRASKPLRIAAKKTGLNLSLFSRVEHEQRIPTLTTIFRLAGWMGIRPGQLVEQVTVERSEGDD